MSTFLTDLLDSASPWNRKNETTVRQLLEEAATRIPNELADQPAARAQLLETIGASEFHLGHLDRAEKLLREALRLRIAIDGANSPKVAGVLNDLGLVMKHREYPEIAEQMLRRSLVIREKAYGHVHRTVARGLFDLATILAMERKNREAEAAFRESLALREKLFASGSKDVDVSTVALTMNGLGKHLMATGHLVEAEQRIRGSLELRRRNRDHGYAYAMSILDLGNVVAQQHRFAEAEALDREGLALLENFVEPSDARIEDAKAQLAAAVRSQMRTN